VAEFKLQFPTVFTILRIGGPKTGPKERIDYGTPYIESVRRFLLGPLAEKVSANGGEDKEIILDALDQTSVVLQFTFIIMKNEKALLEYFKIQEDLKRSGKNGVAVEDIADFVKKYSNN
jgi:hypothetical protein